MKSIFLQGYTLDDHTVTHLLGFLSPEQWADAIVNASDNFLNVIIIRELIRHQEETYKYHLIDDVELIIESIKDKGD